MKMFLLAASTQVIAEKVALFQNLFIAFLVLACFFLILAVLFFFLFDIVHIVANLSGRTARRSIREIEQMNAETGRMRSAGAGKKEKTRRQGKKAEPQKTSPLEALMLPEEETALLDNGKNETTLLTNIPVTAPPVAVPPAAAYDYSATSSLEEETAVKIGKFVILRDITLIHTEESL